MLELYKITAGGSNRALLTSSSSEVVYSGDTYIPTAIKRSKILSRPNLLQNNVTIQLSVHERLPLELLAEVSKNLSHRLIIYRGESVGSLSQIWAGNLIQQGCSGEAVNLTYGGGGVALRQLGDRRPFQRRCPFVLYDTRTCRATPQTATATVSEINTTRDVLSVSGISSATVGYYTGGVICPSSVYDRGNAGNSFISSHNKTAGYDQIRLTTPVSVSVGDSISLLAGCDRTWQTCYGKFNNIINFGGFPYLPLENPYIAEVCSDDGATIPILSLSGNYSILIALDFSGSMSSGLTSGAYAANFEDSRFGIARRQIGFLLDNIMNGLEAGGGTASLNVIGWSGVGPGGAGRGAVSSYPDNARIRESGDTTNIRPINRQGVTNIKNWLDTITEYSDLGVVEPDGNQYDGTPADKATAYGEWWFAQGNNPNRRNIMLFITDGVLSTSLRSSNLALRSFNLARNSNIVRKTGNFAPPLDVKIYGINILLEDTSQTAQIVNTNTPVAVVTTADPDLYYRILFSEDRAAE